MPTSRATRVTSEANERSWSTIVLMASFSCRISPRTSTVILRDRSPLATAIVTSEMLRTWAVRLLAIRFTLSVRSFHTPDTSGTCAWPPSLPSVPTSRATRVTSDVNTDSCLIIVLTIVAERRNSPSSGRPSTSSRTVCSRLPCATAVTALGEVGHRPHQVVDQRIDRLLHLAPCAGGAVEAHALPRLALPAHHLPDARELLRHLAVGGHDVVEAVGDLAVEPGPVARQAHAEVAVGHCGQCARGGRGGRGRRLPVERPQRRRRRCCAMRASWPAWGSRLSLHNSRRARSTPRFMGGHL